MQSDVVLPEVPEQWDEVSCPLVDPEQHGVGECGVTRSTLGISSRSRSAHSGAKKMSAVPQATWVGAVDFANSGAMHGQFVDAPGGEQTFEPQALVGREGLQVAIDDLVAELSGCA